jgi:hypothetical protein
MIGRFFHRNHADPELDYMAGLLHDVGKLVIAMLFPEGFGYIITKAKEEKLSLSEAERAYFDTDHGALGGWYLERQKVPPIVSEAVRCHHNWTQSVENQEIAAIVNVADAFCHECGIGKSGSMHETHDPFTHTESWYFLTQKLRLRGEVVVLEKRLRDESERLSGLVDIILPKPKLNPAKKTPVIEKVEIKTPPVLSEKIAATPTPEPTQKKAIEPKLTKSSLTPPAKKVEAGLPSVSPTISQPLSKQIVTQAIAIPATNAPKKVTAPAPVPLSKVQKPIPEMVEIPKIVPVKAAKTQQIIIPPDLIPKVAATPPEPTPGPVEAVIPVLPPAPEPVATPPVVNEPKEIEIAEVAPSNLQSLPEATATTPSDSLLSTSTNPALELTKPRKELQPNTSSDLAFEHPLLKSAS